MKSLPPRLVIASILLLSIGCDQATKRVAVAELRDRPTQSFAGDTFRLGYAEDPGAFLGMGGTMSETARFWSLTIAVGALLLVGLGYLAVKGRGLQLSHAAGLALILGGGLSNWFDRLVNDGVVVDFLNLGIGSLRTGIFNVADIAIMGGAVLVAFSGRSDTPPAV